MNTNITDTCHRQRKANMEDLKAAIELAEMLAKAERRLTKLQELAAPEPIIASESKLVANRTAQVHANKIAAGILDQARVAVAMAEAREQYLAKNTLLGRYRSFFDDLYTKCANCGGELVEHRVPEETFRVIEEAIHNNNQVCAVWAIKGMFDRALYDLAMRTDEMPPLPPPYTVR